MGHRQRMRASSAAAYACAHRQVLGPGGALLRPATASTIPSKLKPTHTPTLATRAIRLQATSGGQRKSSLRRVGARRGPGSASQRSPYAPQQSYDPRACQHEAQHGAGEAGHLHGGACGREKSIKLHAGPVQGPLGLQWPPFRGGRGCIPAPPRPAPPRPALPTWKALRMEKSSMRRPTTTSNADSFIATPQKPAAARRVLSSPSPPRGRPNG